MFIMPLINAPFYLCQRNKLIRLDNQLQKKLGVENKLKYTGYTLLTLMLIIMIIDRLFTFNLDYVDALKGFLGLIGVIALRNATRIKAEE